MDKFVRYTNECETLNDAWGFIMDHVDDFPLPYIEISPVQELDRDLEVSGVHYAALIQGDITP